MVNIGEGESEWLLPDNEKRNDLDYLLVESDVMDDKFVNQKRREYLFKNCKEIMTAYELLYRFDRTKSLKYDFDRSKGIVVLGLFNLYETSQGIVKFTEAEYALKSYDRYDIKTHDLDRTRKFMNRLLDDRQVGDIIFLVPPKMYSFPLPDGKRYRDTAEEFNFLLKVDDPKKLSKVRLVFGAYEMVDGHKFDEDTWAENGIISKDYPTEMERSARYELLAEYRGWLEGIPKV